MTLARIALWGLCKKSLHLVKRLGWKNMGRYYNHRDDYIRAVDCFLHARVDLDPPWLRLNADDDGVVVRLQEQDIDLLWLL